MGSIGAKKSSVYRSTEDFEKDVKDYSSPEAKAFSDAYTQESKYTSGLVSNLSRSIEDDGYTKTTDDLLDSEQRMTEKELKALPEMKTPAQLGTYEALRERLNEIERLRQRRGEGASKRETEVVNYKRR